MNPTPTLDTPTVRRVAVAADVDPRTVLRVLRGEPTKPTMRRRVMAALVALGFLPAASSALDNVVQSQPVASTGAR